MSSVAEKDKVPKGTSSDAARVPRLLREPSWRYTWLALLLIPVIYLLTLARTPVMGDPSEYTVVAHVLGIAHPPGYAFTTLAGKVIQLAVPSGTIAWRMHLLAAVAATASSFFLYATVRTVTRQLAESSGQFEWLSRLAALSAAFSLAFAADIWQHSIHANPHIITATFLLANLFFLSRYWASAGANSGWLFAFSLSAGLGVTHHPLTVFGFPAYALLILLVRPEIWREWPTLLGMLGCALLGLSVWLYFPIRSPMEPVLGPATMNTLDGFLDHILARGLSDSLPFFALVDQPDRLQVFWSLLRLQFPLPTIFLAIIGLGAPLRRINGRRGWSLFLFYAAAFLGFYSFVISLRAQDIMAYLLGPFELVALLAGLGLFAAGQWLFTRWPGPRYLAEALLGLALLLPLWQLASNGPNISLRHYREGTDYVEAVFDRFAGQGEGAVLLNNWEFMTPLWYSRWVEERYPDPADVRPEWVSTGATDPWVEAAFNYLGGGPVYLHSFRPEIVAAGFRLRPRGIFYEVVEPGNSTIPPELTQLQATGGALEFVGYDLPQRAVTAGDYVPLTLAFRAPAVTADYYVPVVNVGSINYTFTTDSHLITPLWQPGEVIVERFDLSLPLDMAAGRYTVTLALKNLSSDSLTELNISLGELTVAANEAPPALEGLLANFRQRVGLASARARLGFQFRQDIWTSAAPLAARPGDVVNLDLEWVSLATAEESYTVFVHLIDGANRPLVALDYTPLGGAAPTHLWIPKWLPGQKLTDPYRLVIPEGLPAGTYHIEVGLYEMIGLRRLHIADPTGNLVGDRLILGDIVVTP